MNLPSTFDVIIIGGSFAGMSAGLTLARSLRTVLIIDSGQPCNAKTPAAHNFITHDGDNPGMISAQAKMQLLNYPSVHWMDAVAVGAVFKNDLFEVTLSDGNQMVSKRLLLATGIQDLMPPVEGFSECWGISVIHCPYCHGYEVRHKRLGILAEGDLALEFIRLLRNWSEDLVLFTNGPAGINDEQMSRINKYGIPVVETGLKELYHREGYLYAVALQDGRQVALSALFTKPDWKQASSLAVLLGCALDEQGYIITDDTNQTTVPGVFAAGDNSGKFRSLSTAVASGTLAGAFINRSLVFS
jgi:thioredoxin reductase